MRDRSEVWCEAIDISMNEIEKRASLAYERRGVANLAFISPDLCKSLMSFRYGVYNMDFYNGANVIRIMTSAGELHVKIMPKLRNFLLVGTEEDYNEFTALGIDPIFLNDEERKKINMQFEKHVLNGE